MHLPEYSQNNIRLFGWVRLSLIARWTQLRREGGGHSWSKEDDLGHWSCDVQRMVRSVQPPVQSYYFHMCLSDNLKGAGLGDIGKILQIFGGYPLFPTAWTVPAPIRREPPGVESWRLTPMFHQAPGTAPYTLCRPRLSSVTFHKGGKIRTAWRVKVASKTGNTDSKVGERKSFSVLNHSIIINT